MAWTDPSSLIKNTGDLVEASDWNALANNLAELGGADGLTGPLPDPGYDSGWFAVTTSTTYTKAHGLGSTPRIIHLYHAAVAAPGAGDEIVVVDMTRNSGDSFVKGLTGADGTNVYVQTEATNTVWSLRRSDGTGYYRIQAWE